MAEVQIQSMSHRHMAIADWLLAHPSAKNMEPLCNEMNISRAWLSVVMNSDAFREYFERRRKEWEQGTLNDISRKVLAAANKAWDKTIDALDDDGVDPRLLFDVAQKTTERLFGRAPTTVVKDERTVEVTRSVDAGTLAEARETFKRTVTTVKEVPLELPAPE